MSKLNIKKFYVLSPEKYKNIIDSILIPPNLQLKSVDKQLLDVMKNETLSDIKKLLMYNNIITESLSKTIKKPIHTRQNDLASKIIDYSTLKNKIEENDTPFPMYQNESFKIEEKLFNIPKGTKKQNLDLVKGENENFFLPIQSSSPIKTNKSINENSVISINDSSQKNHYKEDMYENFPSLHESDISKMDFRDYNAERDKLHDEMRRLSGVHDIRDIEILRNNPNESYVKFRRTGSFTEYLTEKPEVIVDEDELRRLKNTTALRQKRKKKTIRNEQASPSTTRSKLVYKGKGIKWISYEDI